MTLYREKLEPYADRRRTLLLDVIEKEHPGEEFREIKEKLASFDIGKFYEEGWKAIPSRLEILFLKFCGQTKKRENVKKTADLILEEGRKIARL